MTGSIRKGPTREEMARAMFFDGERVLFVVEENETGRQVNVSAKIVEAKSDGTYENDQRSGWTLEGNCRLDGDVRSVRYDALYMISSGSEEGEFPFHGRFNTK